MALFPFLKRETSSVIDFTKRTHLSLILLTEVIGGFIIVLIMLGIFFKLAEDVVNREVISFDSVVVQQVYLFRTPFNTILMKDITFFGGGVFLTTAIIVTIFLLYRHHKKESLVFSFVLFFGIFLNILLKDVFARPRPNLFPLIHESSYSFPSGHSMNSFVFYGIVVYFIFRNTRNKQLGILLSFASIFLIFCIGISRIYLGVHYPSDVIAGYAAGFCWIVLVLLVEKTLVLSKFFTAHEMKKR